MIREPERCHWPNCLYSSEHSEQQVHHQINLFLKHLDEQPRPWYAALEFRKISQGGDVLLVQITGLDVETVRRGRREEDGGGKGENIGPGSKLQVQRSS